MFRYCIFKVFLVLLLTTHAPTVLNAQWDTAVFSNGEKIIYTQVLASGRNLPSIWLSLTLFHCEAMYIGKRRTLADVGANLMLGQYYRSIYVDYNFSLLEFRPLRKSGPVEMGTGTDRYLPVRYIARFNGIQSVVNFGLHAGAQSLSNNLEFYYAIPNATGNFMATLRVTHELDFGLTTWVRRGIVINSQSGPHGRFFMFRLNADAALYRFSKFAVVEVDSTGLWGLPVEYRNGSEDELGRWKFADLPFKDLGAKITADFYWSRSPGKRSPEYMFGYRTRLMLQYVPIFAIGNFIFAVNFGFTVGMKPRLITSYGMAIPTPLPPKEKK